MRNPRAKLIMWNEDIGLWTLKKLSSYNYKQTPELISNNINEDDRTQ